MANILASIKKKTILSEIEQNPINEFELLFTISVPTPFILCVSVPARPNVCVIVFRIYNMYPPLVNFPVSMHL